MLDRLFLRMTENRRQEDPDVAAALRVIVSNRGKIRIELLAKSVGMSRRQLERKFKERVGISPKRLCRNLRFKNLLVHLSASGKDSWASTALAFGYYDQSHMVNDFKEFTGISPTAYVDLSHGSEKFILSSL